MIRLTMAAGREGMTFARPATIVDRAISEDLGIVVTDDNNISQVWMTAGEVVSYRLYGRAFTQPLNGFDFSMESGGSLGLQPLSEAVFPSTARVLIRRYFEKELGVSQPKGCFVTFPRGAQAVVFEIPPEIFPDADRDERILADLRWRLPKRIPTVRFDQLAGHPAMEAF